jgi:plasmid maintenance system antidote protein VapI
MLFVRSNFSQLSINPLISIKNLSWEDQNLTSESKCEDIISEQPRDSSKLRTKILDGSMLDPRLDEIQDLLNQNVSKVTIAKTMQVPRNTLNNFIKSRALNVIDESILEHRLGEIENLLNQNASKTSIAKTMQVPCTALRDFIKSHGLQ